MCGDHRDQGLALEFLSVGVLATLCVAGDLRNLARFPSQTERRAV